MAQVKRSGKPGRYVIEARLVPMGAWAAGPKLLRHCKWVHEWPRDARAEVERHLTQDPRVIRGQIEVRHRCIRPSWNDHWERRKDHSGDSFPGGLKGAVNAAEAAGGPDPVRPDPEGQAHHQAGGRGGPGQPGLGSPAAQSVGGP